jgi:hypothetical protein
VPRRAGRTQLDRLRLLLHVVVGRRRSAVRIRFCGRRFPAHHPEHGVRARPAPPCGACANASHPWAALMFVVVVVGGGAAGCRPRGGVYTCLQAARTTAKATTKTGMTTSTTTSHDDRHEPPTTILRAVPRFQQAPPETNGDLLVPSSLPLLYVSWQFLFFSSCGSSWSWSSSSFPPPARPIAPDGHLGNRPALAGCVLVPPVRRGESRALSHQHARLHQ